jgi:hypothetical protein
LIIGLFSVFSQPARDAGAKLRMDGINIHTPLPTTGNRQISVMESASGDSGKLFREVAVNMVAAAHFAHFAATPSPE